MENFLCINDILIIFWLVAGDFNNVLSIEERVGFIVIVNEISEFNNCFGYCKFFDLRYKGSFFIWNNK